MVQANLGFDIQPRTPKLLLWVNVDLEAWQVAATQC